MQQVAPTSNRPICHEVQQQVNSVCVTGTSSHIGQSGGEVAGLPMQENHSDCSGVAQHAIVLGPSDHVQSYPSKPAFLTQPVSTALQSDPSQESDKPKSPCMAPRATAIKKQGFPEAVAARIEALQRGSTRSVCDAKWTIFTKWRITNQVDFRAPPVKSVADFLMYLFQDRELQPSTIDGYRSAIADKLGNSPLNISKDENLTRLLHSFHRHRPKGRRDIPSWNLSLVLHQLTKAPFEPIKEASLKHLTFKTVFPLARANAEVRFMLGKTEILDTNLIGQRCPCIHHPAFYQKISWPKRVQTVWPQWLYQPWPQLWIVPSSLTGPSVWSELCATIWTGPQTSGRIRSWSLSPSRKVLTRTSHLPPSPHGSNKLILCYELSDQEALTLHQIKAHHVRAFAASNVFQSGVSLEQILSACHWKSHNTFTQFYLKDVAWADSELYHLGPAVAAQQIHQ